MISYKRIDPVLLQEKHNGTLAQNIYYHVDSLLGDEYRFPPSNIDRIDGLPDPAKNIWYSWYFGAELGGSCSIFNYLVNMVWPAEEIALTLQALENIGAAELSARLRAGIPLSKSENAQFWDDGNTHGLEELAIDQELDDFSIIDRNISELLYDNLDAFMTDYVRKYAEIF